jgi:hypothetical protein
MARDAKNSEIFQECKHMLEVLCFLQYTVQIVKLALIFPAGIWFQLTRPNISISWAKDQTIIKSRIDLLTWAATAKRRSTVATTVARLIIPNLTLFSHFISDTIQSLPLSPSSFLLLLVLTLIFAGTFIIRGLRLCSHRAKSCWQFDNLTWAFWLSRYHKTFCSS